MKCLLVLLSVCASISGQKTEIARAETEKTETDYRVDPEKKVSTMKSLVEKAIPFFQKTSVDESCQAFMNDMQWRAGEIGIFVFNSDGACYVFGQDDSVIWKDFYDKK